MANEVTRIRSLIESITGTYVEEQRVAASMTPQQVAENEFARRMELLQGHIAIYEQLAEEFKSTLQAHVATESDGSMNLVAGGQVICITEVATDYNLPVDIRHYKKMPKPYQSKPDVEWIKSVLTKEVAISTNKKRLLPIVQALVRQLEEEFSDASQGGGSQQTLPKNLSFWGVDPASQEISFGNYDNVYEWSDEGITKLKAAIGDATRTMKSMDEKGWIALKKIQSEGLPVRLSRSLPQGATNTTLNIGEHTIQFSSPKSSLAAYEWALANGAIAEDEFNVRKAVKGGEKIVRKISGHGTSPDHMRQITSYGHYLGGVNLGDPEEPLYQLAIHLIAERDNNLRSKEVATLCVKVRVYAADSRTKGDTVAEVEGPFDSAIQQILQKVGPHLRPRRGIHITVTRIMADGKEGRKESVEFRTETEVRQYLNALTREKFV